MNLESLHSIAASLAAAYSTPRVLRSIVEGVCEEADVALARIWLIDAGDRCDNCHARDRCADQTRCLHLEASDGVSLKSGAERLRNLEGRYSRIPLNSAKIGRVASSGEPILIQDVDPGWAVEPEWAEREQIDSFAGQPLIFRGEILGILGVFSRARLDEHAMKVLRTFANQAAAAIANARAFDEITRLKNRLESENEFLRKEIGGAAEDSGIIGSSPPIEHLRRQIDALAKTNATVLIQGESGTGKELVAQAIHANGLRANRPMIRVNCASIPRDLFDSEFFGHVKGAFTGAIAHRTGRFELADGGTLFLDEVGEIPIELQSKLLRVLQEGTLERIGDARSIRVDVRLITATNRDLRRAVEERRFREDLYYRLNVFPISVPPLRARPGDVTLLAEHFLCLSARRLGLRAPKLNRDQVAQLGAYDWPGNVRELQNVIERALITSRDGALRFDVGTPTLAFDAPVNFKSDAPSYYTYAELTALEKRSVAEALKAAGGKIGGRNSAAELLGIKPTTLAYRIKKLGIRQSRIVESGPPEN